MHSAPYGRACLHCFKAKSRCVARGEGDGCERCHRLQKSCLSSEPIRKRHAQKAQSSMERVAQIEDKLDSLVSMLSSVARPSEGPQTPGVARASLNEAEIRAPLPAPTRAPTRPAGAASSIGAAAAAPTAAALAEFQFANSGEPVLPTPVDDAPEASEAEGEAALQRFRQHMLPCFPFVDLAVDMTPALLRRDQPFLWRCVVASTTASWRGRQARGRAVKRVLAQAAVVENQSSLDLLQGLLVYVAWGCDQVVNRAGTLSRLMALAQSLVDSLRLNRPLPPDEHMLAAYLADFHKCWADTADSGARALVLERQRAVLACFVLSSSTYNYFAQGDPMRWTPRMDGYLRSVARSGATCAGDQVLAFQVRAELILQRGVLLREEALWGREGVSAARTPYLPVHVVKTLQAQVTDLRTSLSAELGQRQQQQRDSPSLTLLLVHTHYVDLSLNEMCFSAKCTEPFLPTNATMTDGPTTTTSSSASSSSSSSAAPPSARDAAANAERASCLWRSVTAIHALFEALVALPGTYLVCCPYLLWAQTARAIVTLYRLSMFSDPAWDAQAVRRTVDLLGVLDHFSANLDAAVAVMAAESSPPSLPMPLSPPLPSSDNLNMHLSRLLRTFRTVAACKLAPEPGPEDTAAMNYEALLAQATEGGADMWLSALFELPSGMGL